MPKTRYTKSAGSNPLVVRPASENGGIINSDNLKLEDNMKEFYKYFKVNNKIRDLDYNEEFLKILSKDILKQIKKNEPGWEDKVPKAVSEMIIKNKMFGYK